MAFNVIELKVERWLTLSAQLFRNKESLHAESHFKRETCIFFSEKGISQDTAIKKKLTDTDYKSVQKNFSFFEVKEIFKYKNVEEGETNDDGCRDNWAGTEPVDGEPYELASRSTVSRIIL